MEERFEGYVVDVDCIRRWPQSEIKERAARHSVTCSLSGQSMESGYCIVDDDIVLLDSDATPMIVTRLRQSDYERGVRLRLVRRKEEKEMTTTMVELAIPRQPVESSNIRSVGYQDNILEIEFRNGTYQFLDVPKHVYEGLLAAESHGRYFNYNVRNKFQSRKI